MNRKKILIITGVILAVIFIFIGRYLYRTLMYKDIISNIIISNPSLTTIEDGTYKGSFDAILIKSEVEVIVEGDKIKDILLLEHKNERGNKAEAIIDEVISAQSLDVDTITGATNSSKVILKSIENALTQHDN